MAVAPGSIVEHLDVFEDVCLGEIACSVDLLPDSLLFQAAEERLRNRVVPTVPSAAHAGVELVCFAETDPVVAAAQQCHGRLGSIQYGFFPIQVQFNRMHPILRLPLNRAITKSHSAARIGWTNISPVSSREHGKHHRPL